MSKKDALTSLYEQVIEEQLTPLAVQKSAKGDGKTGGLASDGLGSSDQDLPADAASTKEIFKGTGPEAVKNVKTPEEADERLSPVKKDKGTQKISKSKTVTESEGAKKSFMDLFDQVMVNEEGEDIESPEYNDEEGDFPEGEGEGEMEAEMGEDDLDEGEIYSQLSDLFAQLARVKGSEVGDMGMEEPPVEAEDEMPVPAGESVDPVEEAKSEPEPREDTSDVKARQHPTKLAGVGVDKKAPKKAAIKGNDKKRTGELEDAPEGFRHDKGKFAVKGDGPAHRAGNASAFETA